jgi:hypothetical protein
LQPLAESDPEFEGQLMGSLSDEQYYTDTSSQEPNLFAHLAV